MYMTPRKQQKIPTSQHPKTGTLIHACVLTIALLGTGITPAHAIEIAPGSSLRTDWIDTAVRPQDDLSGAANRGRATDHVSGDQLSVEEIYEKGFKRAADSHAPQGTPRQRIGDLYASFIDEATVENLGIGHISETLRDIDTIQDHKSASALIGSLVAHGIAVPISAAASDYPRYRRTDLLIVRYREASFASKIGPGSSADAMRVQQYLETLLTHAGDDNPRQSALQAIDFQRRLNASNATARTQSAPNQENFNRRRSRAPRRESDGRIEVRLAGIP
jgi:hypothetical protein